jgi:Acetyltransferase (GNAT) domain
MPYSIRRADLDVDRQLLADLHCDNLSPTAGDQRFDWLYLGNPHGSARAWIAIDKNTGKGVGAAAAFPRRLSVRGSSRVGYVLGDFCIDRQYRSLGLALQLQRTCLEQVGSECPASSYDFPSDRMMAIYRRMRIEPMGIVVRWSKLLRAERKIGQLVKSSALAKILAAPVNKLLDWKDTLRASNGGWTIAEHLRDCDEEFTQLARAVGSRYGTCIERSAEYLNWRYLRHPSVHHQILTARCGGELKGYVVFACTEKDATIVDLFGFSDTPMWTALVTGVVRSLRARMVMNVSFPALATNPWAGLLPKWGFHPRESSPVVVYASGKVAEPKESAASSWFLVDGDRES